MALDEPTREILHEAARRFGTPCYVYFADRIVDRFAELDVAFGNRFHISYAVKANPNRAILVRIQKHVESLDVSSIGEVELAIEAGYAACNLTFSGPAKRNFEIDRAVELGVGTFICESHGEIETLERIARGRNRRVPILLRINPQKMPHRFGISMAGKASQFGIDEEHVDALVEKLSQFEFVCVSGFHIYSGTNSLSEDAIGENFANYLELFRRFSVLLPQPPRKLVFGSGFGIPYYPSDKPLQLDRLATCINPLIDAMKLESALAYAKCYLEMGRWLVGPAGFLLTSVVATKSSRGTEIRMCDAGFNNHLAACGMMGAVIRRNWQFHKVAGELTSPTGKYTLVGPLCTTIDVLATNVELPDVRSGDVLAVGASGAYGLTASPIRFISHPEPRELLVEGETEKPRIRDVSAIPTCIFRNGFTNSGPTETEQQGKPPHSQFTDDSFNL